MNPFQETILTGPRVRLRWLAPSDADAMFSMLSNAEVARYLSKPPMVERAEAVEVIEQALAGSRAGTGLRFAVERIEDGAVMGTVSLFSFNAASRRCELGYMLGREYWSKGYMSDALLLAIPYAFNALDLNRLEADIDPRNANSGAILERMGFVREGYLRERWIVAGEVSDTVLYGLLRSEFILPRTSDK